MSPVFLYAAIALFGLTSVAAAIAFLRGLSSLDRPILGLTAAGGLCMAAEISRQATGYGWLPFYSLYGFNLLYCLTVTLVFLYMALLHPTRRLSAVLLPYLVLMLLLSACRQGPPAAIHCGAARIWLNLHVITSIIGYAFFTVAAILSLAYVIQDRNLNKKRLGPVFQGLPALETLDHLMYEHISVAFLVFTVSVLLGVMLTHQEGWGTKWLTDPKTVASGVSWLTYAILFHLRMSANHHGRRIALVTIAGFVFVLFTYLGIHVVAHSMHNFITL
jgi:ABC-type transport system involved in cytochrome c biogenesis permease subunit